MEDQSNELTSESQMEGAIQRAREFESFPRIVQAVYRPESGFEFLMLKLDNGARMLIPREDLPELENATPQQACEIVIVPQGRAIWWPQIDDGLDLPDFLENRWGKVARTVAA